jgi:hypothetical protein
VSRAGHEASASLHRGLQARLIFALYLPGRGMHNRAPMETSHPPVSPEDAQLYRAIMDVFGTSKRPLEQYLGADQVLSEARWPTRRPTLEEVQEALGRLVEWGRLQAQPDTAGSDVEDLYRSRRLYRLSCVCH